MKVLIIEDHEDTALLYQTWLAEAGYEVGGIAASVEEALAIASLDAPDAAIVDIGLAGPMIGIEGAQLLRRQCPDCAIVFISGHVAPVIVEAAAAVRPIAYFVKPVLESQLHAALLLARVTPPSSRRTP